MKVKATKIVVLISLLSLTLISFSQSFATTSTGNEVLNCMAAGVKKQSAISAGYTDGFGFVDRDIIINRTDLEGNVIWSKRINHLGIDEPKDLLTTSDSNYVLVGSLGKAGGSDFFIMKFDTLGNTIWQRIFIGSTESIAYEIIEKPFNSSKQVYMVVGSQSTATNGKDIVYLILNEDGTTEIAETRGTSGNDEAYGVGLKSGTEEPVLVGYTDFYGDQDIVYNEMSFDGNSISIQTFDGGGDEYGEDIHGNLSSVYIASNTRSFSTGNNWDMVFTNINFSNGFRLDRRYDFGGDDIVYNMVSYGSQGNGVNGYKTNTTTGNKEGFHTWTDLTYNNEGGRVFSSCNGNHQYYDEAYLGGFNFNQANTLVASSDLVNGSEDIVFENNTCLTAPNSDQSMITNVVWTSIDIRTADFIQTPIVTSEIRDTSILVEDYNLVLQSYCDQPVTCSINAEISTEDTLTRCNNFTSLSVTLENCQTLVWSTGETTETISISSANGPRWYSVTMTEDLCTKKDSVFVSFPNQDKVQNLSNTTSFCTGDTIQAVAPPLSQNLEWYIQTTPITINSQETLLASGEDSVEYIFNEPGTFALRADRTNACGLVQSLFINVDVSGAVAFDVPDTTVCGISPIIGVNNPFSTINYSWNTGETTQQITADTSGLYVITSDLNGCTFSDTVNVIIRPSTSIITNPNILGEQIYCFGDTIEFTVEGVVDSVNWYIIEDQPHVLRDTARALVLQEGTFDIIAYPTEKCEFNGVAIQSYTVDRFDDFDIKDTTLCGGGSVLFMAPSGADSYTWSSGSITDSENISISGDYKVTGIKGECTQVDSFKVEIAEIKGEFSNVSKRFNVWYFGRSAGLDFNTSPPTALTDGLLFTWEGSASISDVNGQLLFYTEGRNVFNRNHDIMPNGTGLNSDPSSAQAAVAVPDPSDDNLYYVFTAGGTDVAVNPGYNYSVVNMASDGGNGEVISKNIPLYSPSTEALAAISHANGTDYWVMTRDRGSEFRAYQVTNMGVLGPVVTDIGRTVTNFRSMVKFSPDGKQMAFREALNIYLYDFNDQTGQLSNEREINSVGCVGAEFSPDGRFLYVTRNIQGDDQIIQFDLQVGDLNAIKSSQTLITSRSDWDAGDLQLGPDGKIYSTWHRRFGGPNQPGHSFLDVIHSPSKKGSASDYRRDDISLGTGQARLGFPSVLREPFVSNELKVQLSSQCLSDSIEGSLLGVTEGAEQNDWKMGDGNSFSDRSVVTHKYASAGMYTVSVDYNFGCETYSEQIEISASPDEVSDSLAICGIQTTLSAGNDGKVYEWFNKLDNSNLGLNQTIVVITGGDYGVKITNETCIDTSTFHVYLETLPSIGIDNPTYHCFEENGDIELTPSSELTSYTWLTDLSTSPLTINIDGTYELSVQGDSICTDTIQIQVVEQCAGIVHIPNAFTPNGDDVNDEFKPFVKFLTQYKMTIFNQWGEVVFVSEDENVHWDGVYKGELQLGGTYSYVLNYQYETDAETIEEEKKGYLNLIR